MSGTTIHDWLRPRLQSLVQEGVARGFDPQAVVATMIDLAQSETFTVPSSPQGGSEPAPRE